MLTVSEERIQKEFLYDGLALVAEIGRAHV